VHAHNLTSEERKQTVCVPGLVLIVRKINTTTFATSFISKNQPGLQFIQMLSW